MTVTPLRFFLVVSGASVAGAILWLVMRWPPGNLGHIAGAAMIISGAVAAATPLARAAGPVRAIWAAAGACAVGAAAEIAGLYRGFFGDYIYTDSWKPLVTLPRGFAFPLLLPVVWFTIMAVCYAYARQRLATWPAVAVAALLAAATDLVAEPMLTGVMGFWIWLEPTPLLGAPYLNAVGWLVTAAAGCAWLALVTARRMPTGDEPGLILVCALAGTAIVGAAHGEPRSLWALALAAPLSVWRPRTTD